MLGTMRAGAPPRAGDTVARIFMPGSPATRTGRPDISSTCRISCWTSGANGMVLGSPETKNGAALARGEAGSAGDARQARCVGAPEDWLAISPAGCIGFLA